MGFDLGAADNEFLLISGRRSSSSGMLVGAIYTIGIKDNPCDTYIAVYRSGINENGTAVEDRIGPSIKLEPEETNPLESWQTNSLELTPTTSKEKIHFISDQSIHVRTNDRIALYVSDYGNCAGNLIAQADGGELLKGYAQASSQAANGNIHPKRINTADTFPIERSVGITFILAG